MNRLRIDLVNSPEQIIPKEIKKRFHVFGILNEEEGSISGMNSIFRGNEYERD